jgi:hypothetical protein
VLFLKREEASIFHPLALYIAFHSIVFVIRPLLVYFFDFTLEWYFIGFYPTDEQFTKTLLISNLGFVVFAVAATHSKIIDIREFGPESYTFTRCDKLSLAISWVILAPVVIYSIIFTFEGVTFGTEGNVQMELAGGISIFTNTTGYIVFARDMLIGLNLLTIFIFRYRWWSFSPFIVFLLYRFFMGWERWTIVVSTLSIIFLFLWERGLRWPTRRICLALIMLLFIFIVIGQNRDFIRNIPTEGFSQKSFFDDRDLSEKLDTPDFANFDFLCFILNVVPERSNTYTYGTQYLQLFTEPIPRILWKNKPVGSPINLINLNDYGNFSPRTASLVGDGWMSGGLIGVILTMGISGIILSGIYKWFVMGNGLLRKMPLLYFIFLAMTVQFFRDGGINIFKFLLFSFFPILLWITIRMAIDAYTHRAKAH